MRQKSVSIISIYLIYLALVIKPKDAEAMTNSANTPQTVPGENGFSMIHENLGAGFESGQRRNGHGSERPGCKKK